MDEQTPTPRRRRHPFIRTVRDIVETLLLAAILYVGVRSFVLPYQVEGASMTPNLHNRERLLVNRSAYSHFDANALWNLLPGEDRTGNSEVYPFDPPQRGDIIVFTPPQQSDKPYIKRIIGLPGDTVTFTAGHVFINGEALDEEYIDGPITECEGSHCDVGPIPDDSVYVLGDNRTNSTDSRRFGLVTMDRIIGKVFFTNWPLDDIGPVSQADYPDEG